MTNLLEYLENTAPRVPDKTALVGADESLSYGALLHECRAVGSFLHAQGLYHESVVVFMRRAPRTIAAFLGVIYAGCSYVPIDTEMPAFRIGLIFDKLQPRAVLYDNTTAEALSKFPYTGARWRYADAAAADVDDNALAEIRARQCDTDPAYIVFTSGSTGIPKGVMGCHRGVIDYVENLLPVLQPDETTVFGNQTPLYFDAFFKELFPALRCGGTVWLIPRELFMFPVKLVEFLNEHRINTICWVASALTMVSALGTFEKVMPQYLRTVTFASEVFPVKQFLRWRAALPQARFINFYGPTECTGVCCYYIVDREFSADEVMPIGRPFHNTGILLLDENDREAAPGQQGEICVRGTGLTLGYFRDPERTAAAFVQNPLNTDYPERIYRTGDIGRYNERGELVFVSRKDYQIKHMGHRIELGEIEAAAQRAENVRAAACLYDNEKKRIVLLYTGETTPAALTAFLRGRLPRYMLPNRVEQLEKMLYTPNGKLDRKTLSERYI